MRAMPQMISPAMTRRPNQPGRPRLAKYFSVPAGGEDEVFHAGMGEEQEA